METTLRMFYARALGFVLFVLVMLFAMAMLAAPAFAQDAPAVPETDFIDLIFSTTSVAIYWLLGLLWVALKPPEWLKAFFTTNEAFKWDSIVDTGLDRAEALVRKWGYDAMKDQSGWVNAMVTGFETFNPEIVDYFDKNKNGVIDYFEGYMPPKLEPGEKLPPPGLIALIATRLPEGVTAAPHPLMGSAPARRKNEDVKPRASNDAMNRLASIKGATKQ